MSCPADGLSSSPSLKVKFEFVRSSVRDLRNGHMWEPSATLGAHCAACPEEAT